jgi:phage repressor protein C with HTH and peptisase S24 domain
MDNPADREVENRRRRLREWIGMHYDGVPANFVRAHKLNQSEISGLLNKKSFGSRKARILEQQVGMPERYLDTLDAEVAAAPPARPLKSPLVWPFSTVTLAEVEALDRDNRLRLDGALALAMAQLRPPVSAGSGVKVASQLARHRVNVDEIAIDANQAANDDAFQEVRRFKVKFAAGSGIYSFQHVLGSSLAFRHEFLRENRITWENGAIVYAAGSSMDPVIPDGAAMLMRREQLSLDEIVEGAVYGLMRRGELLVKAAVRNHAGLWVARSYNAEFEDVMLEGDESVVTVGQIVWSGARLLPDGGKQWAQVTR